MDIYHNLKDIFNKQELIILLAKAYAHHKKSENAFKKRILKIFSKQKLLEFPHIGKGFKHYFSKNAFSILFLSILDFLKIPSQRVHLYGILNHAIRGIVTNGDNILDNENKGAFKVMMKEGHILSNIFSILLQNSIVYEVLHELNPVYTPMLNALFSGFYAVANGESIDESAIQKDLSPEEVLNNIHSLRGGALMQLAFIVPEINEKDIDFSTIKQAIFHIGLAVQIIDDIVDLFIDLEAENHNLLASTIIYEHLDGDYSRDHLITLSKKRNNRADTLFPVSSKKLIDLSIHNATLGFEQLSCTGYPIDKKNTGQFLHYLFQVRNVEYLWNL